MIHFDDQTKILREKLVTMAVLAEAAVQGAIKALVNRDDGLASAAREEDKAIDELQIEIDDLAVGLLTKGGSPSDVRLITVVMKIAGNLERVGDEATTISRRAFDLNQDPQLKPEVDIPERADIALKMLREALQAFVSGDQARARAVIPRDKEMDALNKQLHRELTQQIMNVPSTTPRCLNLMVISKSLERIADHATNIAEDVVFLYEGRDIRHTGRGKARPVEVSPTR